MSRYLCEDLCEDMHCFSAHFVEHAGPRADANPSVHRGPAGEVRGGHLPAGGGAPERLPAPGGKVDGTGQRDPHHGSLEADGWLVPRLLVGVR